MCLSDEYNLGPTWANPRLTSLEDQALVPMYGEHPNELGLDRSDPWLEKLRRDQVYQKLFAGAFQGQQAPITRDNAVKAIPSFERTIVSLRSPYDRYHFDREDAAVSDAAERGEVLFHSRPLSFVASEIRPKSMVEAAGVELDRGF